MNDTEKQRMRKANGIMQGMAFTLLWIVVALMMLGIALRIMLWAKGIKI